MPAAAPAAPQTGSVSYHQIVNSVLTAVIVAVVLGAWTFYSNTTSTLGTMQADMARIEGKVDTIAEAIDLLHPRSPSPAPAP